MFQIAEQFFSSGIPGEKKKNVYDNILRKQSLKVLETAESWVGFMGWMSLAAGYLDGNMMSGLSFENIML